MKRTDFRGLKLSEIQRIRDSIADDYPAYVKARGLQRSKVWHKWLLKQLDSVFYTRNLPARLKVVDLGAGAGVISACLAKAGASVTCIDTWNEYKKNGTSGEGPAFGNAERLLNAMNKIGLSTIRHDLCRRPWPLPDNHFDIVAIFDVIEHIGDGQGVLGCIKEIRRICRPGGILCVTTPNLAMLRNRLKAVFGMSVYPDLDRWLGEFPYRGHTREFTFGEIRYTFEQEDFQMINQVATDAMLWNHHKDDGTWESGIPFSFYGVALALYSMITFLYPRWRYTCLSVFVKR